MTSLVTNLLFGCSSIVIGLFSLAVAGMFVYTGQKWSFFGALLGGLFFLLFVGGGVISILSTPRAIMRETQIRTVLKRQGWPYVPLNGHLLWLDLELWRRLPPYDDAAVTPLCPGESVHEDLVAVLQELVNLRQA